MTISDILSITIPLGCTIIGAVWFLSARISVLNHRMEAFERQMLNLDKGLVEARQGRSTLWEKHNELTNRVTVVETKVS